MKWKPIRLYAQPPVRPSDWPSQITALLGQAAEDRNTDRQYKNMWTISLWVFLRFGPGLLQIKEKHNATANIIFDYSVLPILWQQFGDGHFLFQHDNTPVHRAKNGFLS